MLQGGILPLVYSAALSFHWGHSFYCRSSSHCVHKGCSLKCLPIHVRYEEPHHRTHLKLKANIASSNFVALMECKQNAVPVIFPMSPHFLTWAFHHLVPLSTWKAPHHSSTSVAGIACEADGLTCCIWTNSPFFCRMWNCNLVTENYVARKTLFATHLAQRQQEKTCLQFFAIPGLMQLGNFPLKFPFMPQINSLSPIISNPVSHLYVNGVPQA